MNKKPKTICPSCNGLGHYDPPNISGRDLRLTCPTCNGKGKIKEKGKK